MNIPIFCNAEGTRFACTLDAIKNSATLRPIGQLVKELATQAKNHGFDHALATRQAQGVLTVSFDTGLSASFQVKSVIFDFAQGRPPHITMLSTGIAQSSVSMTATPPLIREWIDATTNAGCIYCATENASACELCSRTKDMARA